MREHPLIIGGSSWLGAAAAAALTTSMLPPLSILDAALPTERWAKRSRGSQTTYRKGFPRLHATKGYRGKHKLWRKGR